MSTTSVRRGPATPETPDSLHLSFGRSNRAKGSFTVHAFEDHGHTIAYLPSLNLSAYGDSADEARDRLFTEVLDDFMENLMALSPEKANMELQKLGWSRSKIFKKQYKANSFVDQDGVLKNFDLPKGTKIDTRVIDV